MHAASFARALHLSAVLLQYACLLFPPPHLRGAPPGRRTTAHAIAKRKFAAPTNFHIVSTPDLEVTFNISVADYIQVRGVQQAHCAAWSML